MALVRGLLLVLFLSVAGASSVDRYPGGCKYYCKNHDRGYYYCCDADPQVPVDPCRDPRLEFDRIYCFTYPCPEFLYCPSRLHSDCSQDQYCCQTKRGEWACGSIRS
ncbi:uncharacterized protein LOC143028586 [Oratosquilla oratoria]|uniref:uncharacterized protein LOC143028586 n=1 Tax=Oratosquilla oratoria TaxID=337810 RepID=UPI003F76E51E